MLQEPAAFATAVQGLLTSRRQAQAAGSAAAGDHLCFLGSGRNEEDQYTHMVVSSFLQKHTLHVSMVFGGFEGKYSNVEFGLVYISFFSFDLILSLDLFFGTSRT